MFNFGDDDKEKLKENMEQIKEMVNQGQQIDQNQLPEETKNEPVSNNEQDSFQPLDSQKSISEDEGDSADQESQVSSFSSQQGDRSQDSGQPEKQELDQMEESLQGKDFDEKFGPQNTDNTTKQGSQQQSVSEQPDSTPKGQNRSKTTKQDFQQPRDVNNLSQEVPSPPETREIDVPDIDRGPLFLRQQKFRKAKRLIDEMLYLSKEMEDTVNDLEAGIQEDQRIEQDVREMLHDFDEDRSTVKDIISPRED